jgi:hypothetical protein
MTRLPQRKGWDGRRAAPYAGPDPIELSRQRAEAEASGGVAILIERKIALNEQGRGGAA